MSEIRRLVASVICPLLVAGCGRSVELRGRVLEAPAGGFPLVLTRDLGSLTPVDGAVVGLELGNVVAAPPTITDGAGRFRFLLRGLRPPEKWTIVVDAPGFPVARIELTRRDASGPFAIVLRPGGSGSAAPVSH